MFRLFTGAAVLAAFMLPRPADAIVIANDSERELTVTITGAGQPPSQPVAIDPGAAGDLPGLCLGGCRISIVIGTQAPVDAEADDDNFLVIYKGKRAVSVLEIESVGF